MEEAGDDFFLVSYPTPEGWRCAVEVHRFLVSGVGFFACRAAAVVVAACLPVARLCRVVSGLFVWVFVSVPHQLCARVRVLGFLGAARVAWRGPACLGALRFAGQERGNMQHAVV